MSDSEVNAPASPPAPRTPLRVGILGAGFWTRFQVAAWQELEDVRVAGIWNRTSDKARAVAEECGIDRVHADLEGLLSSDDVDVVDIVTDVVSHADLVRQAAEAGKPVICQKPLASTTTEAESMIATCRRAGVPLLVHENFRWQRPLRRARELLDSGVIGRPFRARIQFSSSFPVFDNQPFLRTLDQFLLADVGTHILDVARFLLGEFDRIACVTTRVDQTIRGEDVATVLLARDDVACTCEMSYASRLENEQFPETYLLVEGGDGSIAIGPSYRVSVTTAAGTLSERAAPHHYPWADPAYDLVHASIVDCHRSLAAALRGGPEAETTASDNLETLRLVYAAYEAAETKRTVSVAPRT